MDVENLLSLNPNQLLAEITSLLIATSEPSETNALLLNHELQRRLHQVRAKVLALLKSVRARYARNEEILIRRLKPRTQCNSRLNKGSTEMYGICGAIRRGATFHFKGNLYFRDIDGRSCPNNEDYEARSHTEMFPSDFDMRSKHVWTILDKKNLIMGIKQQLLDHAACEKAPNSLNRKPIERHVRSLASLLANADSSFSIDWTQISTLDLEFRHSTYSSEAMWRVYLHPQLSREDWSASEDAALVAAAKANHMQNWEKIASASKSTLIGRYTYTLHPSISHAPFTTTEDIMLFAAVEEYNGKFNSFPRTLFPNRSLAQLRTRYHNNLAQRTKTDPWSVLDDTKLMDFVTEHGAAQWVNCAAHLGNHTRTSCRTRFLVIKRFLEQHPSATVADFPRRRCFKNKNNIVTADNWAECLEVWQQDPDSIDPSKHQTRPSRAGERRSSNIKVGPSEIDVQVYEYFKYSYDLQLRASPSSEHFSIPKDALNLAYVIEALNYKPPASKNLKPIQSVSMPLQL
ncbi:GL21479 [Drosophila persimilis]|uniref:GL21479 n=1 Tax=Drosophila persimilis TaxID=7234 RepID=B4GDV5_DROPE|nr:GL21479 [Drosophila persimilis]